MSGINIFELHWFLLVARPNRVFKAAAALQDRGLVTALPYGWRSRRRGSRHCKSVHRFPRPELGNYLMTGFPHSQPAWRSLFEDPALREGARVLVEEVVRAMDGRAAGYALTNEAPLWGGLHEGKRPPPAAIVEHQPNGGLLMAATDETFDAGNPSHMAAARAIEAAAAPFNALTWPPENEASHRPDE